jgi:hypothetical protein
MSAAIDSVLAAPMRAMETATRCIEASILGSWRWGNFA